MASTKRPRGKPFQPGNRFGQGRPAGSRNKATLACQSLLEGEGESITRKAIELAQGGDLTAIRICLERLLPPCRERRLQLDLPHVRSLDDLTGAYKVLFQSIAEGDLTVTEAEQVANVLELARRAIETQEIAQRLKALEEQEEKELPNEPVAA